MVISPEYAAALGDLYDEVEAENAKLRVALRHIADFPFGSRAEEIREYAKQALDSPVEM